MTETKTEAAVFREKYRDLSPSERTIFKMMLELAVLLIQHKTDPTEKTHTN